MSWLVWVWWSSLNSPKSNYSNESKEWSLDRQASFNYSVDNNWINFAHCSFLPPAAYTVSTVMDKSRDSIYFTHFSTNTVLSMHLSTPRQLSIHPFVSHALRLNSIALSICFEGSVPAHVWKNVLRKNFCKGRECNLLKEELREGRNLMKEGRGSVKGGNLVKVAKNGKSWKVGGGGWGGCFVSMYGRWRRYGGGREREAYFNVHNFLLWEGRARLEEMAFLLWVSVYEGFSLWSLSS